MYTTTRHVYYDPAIGRWTGAFTLNYAKFRGGPKTNISQKPIEKNNCNNPFSGYFIGKRFQLEEQKDIGVGVRHRPKQLDSL